MKKAVAEKRAKKQPSQADARKRIHSSSELNPIARYIMELRLEWSKITFPEKKELWRSTLVVFIFTIAVTAVIAVYDMLVTFVFSFLFK